MKVWGPKCSVCPLRPRETKFFGGISRDLGRDISGVPEKFEKTNLCSIFVAYQRRFISVFFSVFLFHLQAEGRYPWGDLLLRNPDLPRNVLGCAKIWPVAAEECPARCTKRLGVCTPIIKTNLLAVSTEGP